MEHVYPYAPMALSSTMSLLCATRAILHASPARNFQSALPATLTTFFTIMTAIHAPSTNI